MNQLQNTGGGRYSNKHSIYELSAVMQSWLGTRYTTKLTVFRMTDLKNRNADSRKMYKEQCTKILLPRAELPTSICNLEHSKIK